MASSVLIDTNIVILHLSDILILPAENEAVLLISVLTKFELLRYPGMGRTEETQIRTFLNFCELIPINERIADQAAFLRRTHRIGTVDLLIAATALECHIPLITRNVKDFRHIPNLDVRTEI
ncbi:MAG TPA: nucleotide-binding protein [Candidatus Magasanikbacteria bacterium]|nr:MAG: hypothetical protein A3I74_02225 [Candidatus Magasanikbacteria bacterium RIFCSPLOWO2_02_FULL_47_16]OGH79674.1 MAG: hypothetical protein A3C10_01175 [Candidatus Magasanikbacteria bacterium RIFCSPHIGHO2_02_FULL_48_18]OGH82459.1 MAG: hypothetical protein A3G08_01185 [Candidatus Magasanikbacteria bacterium RIFCSPLOWO2_12_FULL_47_9b]HAZ28269.1 nucleotide-binding protein [Candidatus Magasanikbacteria bacterium]